MEIFPGIYIIYIQVIKQLTIQLTYNAITQYFTCNIIQFLQCVILDTEGCETENLFQQKF